MSEVRVAVSVNLRVSERMEQPRKPCAGNVLRIVNVVLNSEEGVSEVE